MTLYFALFVQKSPGYIKITRANKHKAKTHIFSHPDFTVGLGITPSQPRERFVDYTTGREFHPALKKYLIN